MKNHRHSLIWQVTAKRSQLHHPQRSPWQIWPPFSTLLSLEVTTKLQCINLSFIIEYKNNWGMTWVGSYKKSYRRSDKIFLPNLCAARVYAVMHMIKLGKWHQNFLFVSSGVTSDTLSHRETCVLALYPLVLNHWHPGGALESSTFQQFLSLFSPIPLL